MFAIGFNDKPKKMAKKVDGFWPYKYPTDIYKYNYDSAKQLRTQTSFDSIKKCSSLLNSIIKTGDIKQSIVK